MKRPILLCFQWTFLLVMVLSLVCCGGNAEPEVCYKPHSLGDFASIHSGAIGLLVYVQDCQDRPVPRLTTVDFLLREGDSSEGTTLALLPKERGFVLYLTLLIDMSTATRSHRSDLVLALQAFVHKVLIDKKLPVKIGITLFAGSAQTVEWVRWSGDAAQLKQKLQELTTYQIDLPDAVNLYDAVLQTSQKTRLWADTARLRSYGSSFGQGMVLLFSEGVDTVSKETFAWPKEADPHVKTPVLAVGLKASGRLDQKVLEKLAPAGVFLAEYPVQLGTATSKVADTIAARIDAIYLIGFVLQRFGTREVHLQVKGADNPENRLTVSMQSSLPVSSQDPIHLQKLCQGRECGGLACGVCDEATSSCDNRTGRCVNHCLQAGKCRGERFINLYGYEQTCVPDSHNVLCGDTCADLRYSSSHCGRCRKSCSSDMICKQGVCTCSQERIACRGACVDPKTDPSHCGRCDNVCINGRKCINGACQCPEGQTTCDLECVDLNWNSSHCGRCFQVCDSGSSCSQGVCHCFASSGKTTLCGGQCIDTFSSDQHCGGCGKACRGGSFCLRGSCQCYPSQVKCAERCTNLATDPNHCGRCNNACRNTQVCQNGSCTDCAPGESRCNNLCANLQTSYFHCGSCNNSCKDQQHCLNGRCVCLPSRTACNGACVDLSQDNNHCGRCNNACSGDMTCQSGACRCPTAKSTLCEGRCVNLLTDHNHCGSCGNSCSGEQSCQAGACVCSPGLAMCGAACVDANSNTQHCGRCDHRCADDQVCLAGVCRTCPSGRTRCKDLCIDTMIDNLNCGTCENVCPLGQTCRAGVCK